MRVIIPNIDLDYQACLRQDFLFFDWIDYFSLPENYSDPGLPGPKNEASLEQVFLLHFAAQASIFHKNIVVESIYDEEFRELFSHFKY